MNMTAVLNPEQVQAVEAPPGVNLVLAIPGSGKTTVFCHRIAHLINEQRVDPGHILAITFARKAAQEMSQRLQGLVGDGVHSKVTIGTFHSVCYRMLRQQREFTVIDDAKKLLMFKRIIGSKGFRLETGVGEVIRAISLAKNEMVDPKQFREVYDTNEEAEKIADVYELYEQGNENLGQMDMDDLLLKTHALLVAQPDMLSQYQRRFSHILCDESQDNNKVQTELLYMLARPQDNLYLCADDDQSIHMFRGARADYVLNLGETYPEANTIILNTNYRSTGAILGAANNLIGHNTVRLPKTLKTDNETGSAVMVYKAHDDNDEAKWVSNEILSTVKAEEAAYKDIAVLYRTNQQSQPLEDKLSSKGIPYELLGSSGFYERKGVRELISYLRILQNPQDDASLISVLDVPTRYLGGKIRAEIESYSLANGISCYEALQVMRFPRMYQNKNIRQLIYDLTYLRDIPAGATVGDILSEIRAVFRLDEYIRDNDMEVEDDGKVQSLTQLIRKASEFTNIESFLEYVDMHSGEKTSSPNGVKLLSIHSAKGLEFSVVFLVGCNEGVLPHQRAIDESKSNPLALEEERRLAYVAITRAKYRLCLSYLANQDNKKQVPSRFLKEALPERAL